MCHLPEMALRKLLRWRVRGPAAIIAAPTLSRRSKCWCQRGGASPPSDGFATSRESSVRAPEPGEPRMGPGAMSGRAHGGGAC